MYLCMYLLFGNSVAIHDILGDKNAEVCVIIKNSKLEVEDGNIIVVDYSSLVDDDKDLEAAASVHVQLIAETVNDLLKILHLIFNVNSKNIHLTGFGLGAHIAGVVGQEFFQHSGEKIQRITALDPTGEPFSITTPASDKLTPDDADFVEVVHTNGGEIGFFNPCGHVDYYPNGGQTQPGCNATNSICSHKRSYELVPEMWLPVKNQELLLLKCSNIDILNIDGCRWINSEMGDLEQQLYGVFYLETNSHKPYGKGAFKLQFF